MRFCILEKYLVLITFIGALVALIFAFVTGKKVLGFPEGTDLMKKISNSVKQGANAYLKRQYTVVAVFFIGMFIVETEDGSCKLLPFSLPSVVSLLLCGWVFEALSKRGYFQEK